MKVKRFFKILTRVAAILGAFLVLVILVLIYANWKIPHDTRHFVFDEVDSVPSQKVALVLGAAKNLRSGYPNPYFTKRMQAARELYDAGKVKAFVVSGDNGADYYNEPEDMRASLVALGIPDSIIYMDYAGFRTLDSVVRMNKIFGQDSFIVVSQKFHNERAVFLAQHCNLRAYGYNAKDVVPSKLSYTTIVREKFARVKVFVDIVLNKQPRFLGESVEIK